MSIIGNDQPHYNYGITLGFNWRNLSFNMFWQGVAKWQFNPSGGHAGFFGMHESPNNSGLFKDGYALDYWRPADETNVLGPNTDAFLAKPYFSQETFKNRVTQSRFIMNAAYLRLQNVTVGYNFTPRLLQNTFIHKARIYISGRNLLTIDGLRGVYNPVAAIASNHRSRSNQLGIIHPINMNLSLGVNITF
jgi:hypothetical protein